jgi:hypothetical protein
MWRPDQHTGRPLKEAAMIARLTGLVLAVLAVLLALAAPASAHHVDVSATVSCTGVVSFTATAWRSPSVAGRTNGQIRVSYSMDGRDFVALPAKGTYAFDAANRFNFSDSFPLGHPLPHSVVVAAQATGPWSDRGPAGGPHRTAPLLIPSCPAQSATPTSAPAQSATPASAPVQSAPPAGAPTPSPPVRAAMSVPTPTTTPDIAEAASSSHASIGLIAVGAIGCAALLGAGGWALLRARRA